MLIIILDPLYDDLFIKFSFIRAIFIILDCFCSVIPVFDNLVKNSFVNFVKCI
jgi:hypothetical protein